MKIGIDCGHCLSGYDTGASGCGYREEILTREIGNLVIKYLNDLGHTVINCTVDTSNSLENSLYNRVYKANTNKVDQYIAIHLNAFNGNAFGVETYVYTSSSNNSLALANKVQGEMIKLGYFNRGVKRANYYVLRETSCPAILVECGFIDNQNDMNIYNADNIAKAIVKGITGVEVVSNTTTTVNDNTETYRVRKTWEDSKSQIGAYKILDNAIKKAQECGYSVFDSNGKKVYPKEVQQAKEYAETGTAKVIVDVLNIRDNPNGNIVGQYYLGESFNYNYVKIINNQVWVRYVSYTGYIRWVCVKENNDRYANCY